eukprot:COSAG02_NODE_2202_length_9534_cov_20.277160_10_plen_72_part_00
MTWQRSPPLRWALRWGRVKRKEGKFVETDERLTGERMMLGVARLAAVVAVAAVVAAQPESNHTLRCVIAHI